MDSKKKKKKKDGVAKNKEEGATCFWCSISGISERGFKKRKMKPFRPRPVVVAGAGGVVMATLGRAGSVALNGGGLSGVPASK